MKKTLKHAIYSTTEDVCKAINEFIYTTKSRELVSVTPVAETFLGTSSTYFIIWYNEYIKEFTE